MLSNKPIDDLWRVAAAGGGLDFDASRYSTDQLWRLAAAAGNSGAKLTLRKVGDRATDDLWRLAAAGKGNVVLSD
ncbi:hypothetical protein [Sphingopyxis sp.]|jgi:DNA replication protein|uniref:hypothetical protein n=1 Tax=Sphingopyxis sp. TaxID=1908224 RepID=UPI002E1006F6